MEYSGQYSCGISSATDEGAGQEGTLFVWYWNNEVGQGLGSDELSQLTTEAFS